MYKIARTAFAAISVLTLALASQATAGTVSTLYVVRAFDTSVIAVQGDSIINTFTTDSSHQGALAVNDTIRIMGSGSGIAGSEYDLSGNLLNAGIYTNPAYTDTYDGASDGQYNYTIAHNDGSDSNGTPLFQKVLRFDANWQNATELFTMTQRGSGITHDSSTNSLWTSGGPGAPNGSIQQYSMTGQLLSSFSIGVSHYGLAYDAADDTLWASAWSTNLLYQYSKAGVLLSTTNLGGQMFSSQAAGMEFAPAAVPVPAALPLLAAGLGIFGFVGRRRKSATKA